MFFILIFLLVPLTATKQLSADELPVGLATESLKTWAEMLKLFARDAAMRGDIQAHDTLLKEADALSKMTLAASCLAKIADQLDSSALKKDIETLAGLRNDLARAKGIIENEGTVKADESVLRSISQADSTTTSFLINLREPVIYGGFECAKQYALDTAVSSYLHMITAGKPIAGGATIVFTPLFLAGATVALLWNVVVNAGELTRVAVKTMPQLTQAIREGPNSMDTKTERAMFGSYALERPPTPLKQGKCPYMKTIYSFLRNGLWKNEGDFQWWENYVTRWKLNFRWLIFPQGPREYVVAPQVTFQNGQMRIYLFFYASTRQSPNEFIVDVILRFDDGRSVRALKYNAREFDAYHLYGFVDLGKPTKPPAAIPLVTIPLSRFDKRPTEIEFRFESSNAVREPQRTEDGDLGCMINGQRLRTTRVIGNPISVTLYPTGRLVSETTTIIEKSHTGRAISFDLRFVNDVQGCPPRQACRTIRGVKLHPSDLILDVSKSPNRKPSSISSRNIHCFEPGAIEVGVPKTVQCMLDVPTGAATGLYRGKILVTASNANALLIPMEVQVEPGPPPSPRSLQTSVLSKDQIKLSWKYTDLGAPLDGFHVYRCKRTHAGACLNKPFQKLTNLGDVGPQERTFIDTGLEPDTRYCYQVSAFNDVGESRSTISCAQTEKAPSDTAAPALIRDFQASDQQNRKSTLTWTNPSTSDLAEVMVRRKLDQYPTSHTDGEPLSSAVMAACNRGRGISHQPSARNTCVDQGLVNGKLYYYAVFGRDRAGNWNHRVEEGKNADTAVPGPATPASENMIRLLKLEFGPPSGTMWTVSKEDRIMIHISLRVRYSLVNSGTIAIGYTTPREEGYLAERNVSAGSALEATLTAQIAFVGDKGRCPTFASKADLCLEVRDGDTLELYPALRVGGITIRAKSRKVSYSFSVPESPEEGCRVPSPDYPTIQAALDDKACEIINIAEGTYRERSPIIDQWIMDQPPDGRAALLALEKQFDFLVISRDVTLQGAGSNKTILKSGIFALYPEMLQNPELPIQNKKAFTVIVRDLRIQRRDKFLHHSDVKDVENALTNELWWGVVTTAPAKVILENVVITFSDIAILGQATIQRSRLTRNIVGIAALDSSGSAKTNVLIVDSEISRNILGGIVSDIFFGAAPDITIQRSRIVSNGVGFIFHSNSRNQVVIRNSEISNSLGLGSFLNVSAVPDVDIGDGIIAASNSTLEIYNSRIHDNRDYGIRLWMKDCRFSLTANNASTTTSLALPHVDKEDLDATRITENEFFVFTRRVPGKVTSSETFEVLDEIQAKVDLELATIAAEVPPEFTLVEGTPIAFVQGLSAGQTFRNSYRLRAPNQQGTFILPAGARGKPTGAPSQSLSGDLSIIVTTSPPVNQQPIAKFTFSPSAEIGVRENIAFDGTASTDSDGMITDYHWDFGDGTTLSGPDKAIVTHAYEAFGTFKVSLVVVDDQGTASEPTYAMISVSEFRGGSFRGEIKGRGNQVFRNGKGAICPLDYTLPFGFISAANSTAVTYTPFVPSIEEAQEIQIRIFDLAGRTVFRTDWVPKRFIWKGIDTRGNPLANGVYLYVLTIRTIDGRIVRTEVKKMVLLR